MTKEEARRFLATDPNEPLSLRTIDNYISRGKLKVVDHVKGKRGRVAVLDDESVQSLKDEMRSMVSVIPRKREGESVQLARPRENALESLQMLTALPDYLSRIAGALEAREAPELLTPEEVADRLKLKTATVLRLVREGKLTAVRVGRLYRFRPADIRAFIEGL